jgi:hypothetical protein
MVLNIKRQRILYGSLIVMQMCSVRRYALGECLTENVVPAQIVPIIIIGGGTLKNKFYFMLNVFIFLLEGKPDQVAQEC